MSTKERSSQAFPRPTVAGTHDLGLNGAPRRPGRWLGSSAAPPAACWRHASPAVLKYTPSRTNERIWRARSSAQLQLKRRGSHHRCMFSACFWRSRCSGVRETPHLQGRGTRGDPPNRIWATSGSRCRLARNRNPPRACRRCGAGSAAPSRGRPSPPGTGCAGAQSHCGRRSGGTHTPRHPPGTAAKVTTSSNHSTAVTATLSSTNAT